MDRQVSCPRCNQDFLQSVRLVALRQDAIRCPECDALWLRECDVGPPSEGSYGVLWFDFETYMKAAGRGSPYAPGEVVVIDSHLDE
jgi:hypothetical protein